MNDIMPEADIYEKALDFMSYKTSLDAVTTYVVRNAPKDGTVLDLMCGPGSLIGTLNQRRRDLVFRGVDFDASYIEHARTRHPHITFEVGDVTSWKPSENYDVVLCTGALHHLPYEEQGPFIERMASMITPQGFGILSDCYIDNYDTEKQRQLGAAQLGHAYLRETILNGAPQDVVDAALQILFNDVMGREFKTAIEKRLPLLQRAFRSVETHKTWPNSEIGGYGDYHHILKC